MIFFISNIKSVKKKNITLSLSLWLHTLSLPMRKPIIFPMYASTLSHQSVP